MPRYYIDTCIWMNYLNPDEDEFNSKAAEKLFSKFVNNNIHIIILSPQLYAELERYGLASTYHIAEKLFKVEFIGKTRKVMETADFFSKELKLHRADSMHASYCFHSKAIFITRDKHFQAVINYIVIKKPEELFED